MLIPISATGGTDASSASIDERELDRWSRLTPAVRESAIAAIATHPLVILPASGTELAWQTLPHAVCQFLPLPDPLWVFRSVQEHAESQSDPAICAQRIIREGRVTVISMTEQNGAETWPTDFPRSGLTPRSPDERFGSVRRRLRELQGTDLFPHGRSRADAIACQAGLLQMHDELDASHRCSQAIEGEGVHQAGDYWHAIMHRREPDYGNSKYWFRHVGAHPIFPALGGAARPLLEECSASGIAGAEEWGERLLAGRRGWDPFAFVDMCEGVARGPAGGLRLLAERLQRLEMWLLLQSTCADAAG